MKNYLHVSYDDWEGLYDDERLLSEGHTIPISEFCMIVPAYEPHTLTHSNAELTELSEHVINNGGFPKTTEEALRLLDTEVGG